MPDVLIEGNPNFTRIIPLILLHSLASRHKLTLQCGAQTLTNKKKNFDKKFKQHPWILSHWQAMNLIG